MPPRSSLTGSFSVSDANNEVVCPLTNNDGSNCRKRCLGEKRYRSMQEHIRRAHPDHYIPKLPATEESFQLMVSTPPDQRPRQPSPPAGATTTTTTTTSTSNAHARRAPRDKDHQLFGHTQSSPAAAAANTTTTSSSTPRTVDEAHPAAATAAVALAQLHHHHHHRLSNEWDSEADAHSDSDLRHRDRDRDRDRMRSSIELPPLRDHFKQESIPPPFQSPPRPRELLPSILSHSPPGRSSTLPPIQRRDRPRPRKGSLTQSARKGKHERGRSREYGYNRPSLNDRKALSAEPQTAAWVQGKRWEDLIEAATSATEADDDRDVTPVPNSPSFRSLASVTSAPSAVKHRSSVPPAFQSGLPPVQQSSSSHRPLPPTSYTASPLQKAVTPPPFEPRSGPETDLEPFPSVESSMDNHSIASGRNFHMPPTGLPGSGASNSSPVQPPRSYHTSSYPPPSSHPHHHLHDYLHSRPPHHRLSNPGSFTSVNKDLDIYCASCSRPWSLRDCFACTECICGVCRECVGIITGNALQAPGRAGPAAPTSILNPTSSPGNGISGNGTVGDAGPSRPGLPNRRACPSCGAGNGRWKPFQLEFR